MLDLPVAVCKHTIHSWPLLPGSKTESSVGGVSYRLNVKRKWH